MRCQRKYGVWSNHDAPPGASTCRYISVVFTREHNAVVQRQWSASPALSRFQLLIALDTAGPCRCIRVRATRGETSDHAVAGTQRPRLETASAHSGHPASLFCIARREQHLPYGGTT